MAKSEIFLEKFAKIPLISIALLLIINIFVH